jgi:hypothetical protein
MCVTSQLVDELIINHLKNKFIDTHNQSVCGFDIHWDDAEGESGLYVVELELEEREY